MLNAFSASLSALVVILAFVIAQVHPGASVQADRSFVLTAEQTNNAEVAEGKLAERMGSSKTVRALGARMVRDHSLAEQKLAAVARSRGLAVTTSVGASNERQMRYLQTLHGRAFDRAYVSAVRERAKAALPVLRTHLSLFESAQRRGN